MAYVISGDCISCGACADGCPVGAISEGGFMLIKRISGRGRCFLPDIYIALKTFLPGRGRLLLLSLRDKKCLIFFLVNHSSAFVL